LSYGIIFRGNSSQSITVFKIQKKVIRIMMGYRNKNSCRNLFKILNILRLKSQYIFSLLISVDNNKNYFAIKADNLNTLTRQRNNLHLPQANLAIFKKGVYYSGIRTFSILPTEMKDLSDNPNTYTDTLKHFLFTLFLYSG
jgi:hypothetical protein